MLFDKVGAFGAPASLIFERPSDNTSPDASRQYSERTPPIARAESRLSSHLKTKVNSMISFARRLWTRTACSHTIPITPQICIPGISLARVGVEAPAKADAYARPCAAMAGVQLPMTLDGYV